MVQGCSSQAGPKRHSAGPNLPTLPLRFIPVCSSSILDSGEHRIGYGPVISLGVLEIGYPEVGDRSILARPEQTQ